MLLKRILNIVLSIFVLGIISTGLHAYNENHIVRLEETGNCKRCKLGQANLSGSVIFSGDLRRANLRNANLQGVYFQSVDFQKADL